MNKLNLITATFLVLTLTACIDNKDIDYKLSGELTIQLLDSNDEPLPYQTINLYSGQTINLYSDKYKLESKVSDENGIIIFSHLNKGEYCIYRQDIVENGISYDIEKFVQVLSGDNNIVTITPSDFSGKLTLKTYQVQPIGVQSYSDFTPLKTGYIALIPKEQKPINWKELQQQATVIKQLNNTDSITIEKIPYGTYQLYAYTDSSHISPPFGSLSTNISISKSNSQIIQDASFYSHFLFDFDTQLSLQLSEIVPSSNKYNNSSQTLTYGSVALIPTEKYSNKYGFNALLSIAEANKPVPASGIITFDNISIGSYFYLVYLDKDHYTLASSSINNINSYTQTFLSSQSNTVHTYAYSPLLKDYILNINYSNLKDREIRLYILKESLLSKIDINDESELALNAFSQAKLSQSQQVTLPTPGYVRVCIIQKYDGGSRYSYDTFTSNSYN